MSIEIRIDETTPDHELAALACLIAVLRMPGSVPAPPRILFDYSDGAGGSDAVTPPAAAPAPAPAAPPPPSEPAAPAHSTSSEALLQQEADRAAGAGGGAADERDINGITWDARIHAGTKVKNADQSWRLKRGADPVLVASVTAELKAKAAATDATQPPAADAPSPPSEPAPATVADAATAFGVAGAGGASDAPPPPAADAPAPPAADAPPPPAADATPAPPAAPAAGELTYPAVLSRANEAGLDYNTLNAMAVDMGLEKFASLAKAPATTLRLFADTMEAKIAEGPAAPAA